MKTGLFSILAALMLATVAVPASADHGVHGTDGVTAKIARGGLGDLVFTPWSDGNHVVTVSIFQKDAEGDWSQVSMAATLRVFAWDPVAAEWVDKVSQPFTSSATKPTQLAFSADDAGRYSVLDVFVTFSQLGPNADGKVPTSHMNAAKNHLIDRGEYDTADALDYHATHRVIGL